MGELRAWVVVAAVAAAACLPPDADQLGERSSAADVALDDGGFEPDSGTSVGFDGSGSDAPGDAMFDAAGDGSGSDAPGDAMSDAPGDGSGSDAPGDAMSDAPGDVMPDAPGDAMPDAATMVTVDVTPATIDFGEVRVGTAEPSAVLTVTNRIGSTGAAQLDGVALRIAIPGLVLTPPTTPAFLAPGQAAMATLTLETTDDVDLAGESVDVSIDGAMRSVPVAGKVVTPSSRVIPAELELGTACVGSQVSGSVMLVNDGTATLAVAAPQIDAAFTATSTGTVLAPTQSLTTTVAPASTVAGPLSATLLWHDDVPTDHEVPVTVEYVTSGTAISPKGLDFGTVPVDGALPTQQVKLENCDPSPSTIEIVSLRTKRGTLAAWKVQPRVGTRQELTERGIQDVTVSFDPSGRGRYEAELTIKAGTKTTIIELVGDASGRDFDRTSFYACSCSGGGRAAHSWPAFLILFVVFRRRDRRSSTYDASGADEHAVGRA